MRSNGSDKLLNQNRKGIEIGSALSLLESIRAKALEVPFSLCTGKTEFIQTIRFHLLMLRYLK
ncbi:hypothetical protein F6P74_06670 [Streptococcus suis]|nr:hypothetical protein [Streptococcus suis]MBS8094153.1 hypothetical protein [Streptococcus suis]MBS8102736.1 hypothetical protein [Streptococcus suis]